MVILPWNISVAPLPSTVRSPIFSSSIPAVFTLEGHSVSEEVLEMNHSRRSAPSGQRS